jgi:hypothetical protein
LTSSAGDERNGHQRLLLGRLGIQLVVDLLMKKSKIASFPQGLVVYAGWALWKRNSQKTATFFQGNESFHVKHLRSKTRFDILRIIQIDTGLSLKRIQAVCRISLKKERTLSAL